MVARQRFFSSFCLFAMLSALVAGSTLALAGPEHFTVQGRLFDPAGDVALSETVDIQFSILGRLSGGTECLLYQERHNGVDLSVTEGVFALEVGTATGSSRRVIPGDPGLNMIQVLSRSTCPAGGAALISEPRKLRVTVIRSGGTEVVLSPDQPIGSVPHTQVAETLQGKDPSVFLQLGDINGALTVSNLEKLLDGTQDASALHHHDGRYLQIGASSGTTHLGSVDTYISGGGSLGVGTSTPAARVDVRTLNSSSVGLIVQGAASQSANVMEIRDASGTPLMRVDASGDLILRNSTPASIFHAASKGYVDAQVATREAPLTFVSPLTRAGDSISVGVSSGTASGVLSSADYLRFERGERLQGRSVSSSVPGSGSVLTWDGAQWSPQVFSASQWTTSGNDIYFGNGAGNGNVGINASTPLERLHVGGNALFDGNIRVKDPGQWIGYSSDANLSYQSSNSSFQIKTPQTDPLTFVWGASEKARFSSEGKLGIGVNSPSAFMHLPASTATAGSAPLKFEVGALMTTPEGGAIEFTGTDLYYTTSAGSRRQISSTAPGTPYFPALTAGNIGADSLDVNQSDFTVATDDLVVTGGKVGIGTATPATALDVVGDTRFRNEQSTSSYFDFTDLSSPATSGTQALSHTTADGSFRVLASRGSSTSACTVLGENGSSPVGCGGLSGAVAMTGSALALQGVAIGGHATQAGNQSLLIGTPQSPADTGFGDTGIVDLGTSSYSGGAYSGTRPTLRYTALSHQFRVNSSSGANNPGTQRLAITSTGVGIGTSTPDALLQVVGPEFHFDTAGGGQLQIRDSSAGTQVQTLAFQRGTTTTASLSNSSANELVLETNSTDLVMKSGASTERMRIVGGSGFTGVGTSAPASRLHVDERNGSFNTVSTVMTLDHSTSSGAQAGIGTGILFRAQNDTSSLVGTAALEAVLTDVTTGAEKGSLIFKTLSSGTLGERARFTEEGRLGLGTSNPSARLDVNGNVRILDQTPTTGATTLTVSSGAGQSTTELIALKDGNSVTNGKLRANQLEFLNAGSVKFSDANSLVGSSSTVMTMVGAGTPPVGLGLQSNNHISFAPGGGTEKVRIDSNGRIGMGHVDAISGPTSLIHLKGSPYTLLRIEDSNVASGRVLTSDASGNASWQPLPASSGGTVTSVTGVLPISVTSSPTSPQVSIAKATGSVSGYLDSADFTTFNNKQKAGNYIIKAIGDLATNLASYNNDPNDVNFGTVSITVGGIQGRTVSSTGPSDGQVLKWSQANSQWEPSTDSLGVSQWTTNGSNLYFSTGNVGLGTSTPGDQLTLTQNLQLGASSLIKVGSSRFIHSTGTSNFFAGTSAGSTSTSGTGRNTGVGASSLSAVTTGASNTALGAQSLQSLTTGSNNTAVGREALNANTASDNTAVGVNALTLINSGGDNTALGSGALSSNVTGAQNTALGKGAGSGNLGSGNVFLGHLAGSSASGDNKLYIANSSTHHLMVGDFAADAGLGRVGFGLGSSSTPQATLHVDGTVRLKIGTPQAGQVLTTDADGDATWAAPQYTGTVTSVGVQAGTPLSVTGTTAPVIGMTQASTSNAGWLSSTDWNTFNNKQAAGNYVTATAGDATSSNFNAGTITLTLANSGVTAGEYTKLTVDAKGRTTAGDTLDSFDIPAPTGDVTGTYASLTVAKIQGRAIATTAPSSNQVLGWSGTQWAPQTISASQWTTLGSDIYFSTGSVGLGTSTPASQLHVTEDFELNPTTGSALGVMKQDGIRVFHTYADSGLTLAEKRSVIFLGYEAGNFTATGSGNTGLGGKSLSGLTSGGQNTALGYEALNGLTTASGNTAGGYQSGKALAGGGFNSLWGYRSGLSLTSGIDNSAVGASSLEAATSGEKNTAIGRNALLSLTTGSNNTAVGFEALQALTTTGNNTALGWKAGHSNTGTGNVFLGYQAGMNEAGSDKLYIANTSTNTLIFGDFNQRRVGIATTSPSATFQVGASGDATTTLANEWSTFSDQRLKKNFSRMEDSLEGILKLSGYRYDWKSGVDRSRQVGVIAQEVQKVFPEVVTEGEDGILSVAYDKLVAPIIEAIKSLNTRTLATDERVSRLEAENAALKARLERLEKTMGLERSPASKANKNN